MSERVTAADRRRMASLARDLAEIELDEVPTREELTVIIDAVNDDREARGLPPLHDEEPSEEEMYRRARALGLRPNGG